MDPAEEYCARSARWEEKALRHEQQHRKLGDARLLAGAALVILIVVLCRSFLGACLAFSGIVAALFLSGMIHDRVLKKRDLARRAMRFYQEGLDRMNDNWTGKGSGGAEFLDKHHPYAIDLDLFGAGSLFELLNICQTQIGRATFARWLLNCATRPEIKARQAAVDELRDKLDLREELALLTADDRAHIDTRKLVAWAAQPRILKSGPIRIVLFCLPIVTLILLFFGGGRMAGMALFGQVVLGLVYRKRVHEVLESLTLPTHDVEWLSGIFSRLEKETFKTPQLQQLQAGWRANGFPASECLRKLGRRLEWMDSRENFLLALVGPFFLMGTQFAFVLENWRVRYGSMIEEWLRRLGEIEALSSLGGFAFEHPTDPFPELISNEFECVIDAKGMAHPLIGEDRAVRNDLAMDSGRRLMVVSGSNMSGKSTWLRALGVNMVLAMAGAPVRARQFRLTPMQIGASIRTVDSLQEGTSRFYAEITRLRQIIQLARDGPLLFLFDELLNGTNSHDRRLGAAAIVKNLIDGGAIGLITTHDLALTQIVGEIKPLGVNLHFEDQFIDGKMSFDYRLRAGVVEKSNALDLMRSIGIEVAEKPAS